jgi:hypothetical protein
MPGGRLRHDEPQHRVQNKTNTTGKRRQDKNQANDHRVDIEILPQTAAHTRYHLHRGDCASDEIASLFRTFQGSLRDQRICLLGSETQKINRLLQERRPEIPATGAFILSARHTALERDPSSAQRDALEQPNCRQRCHGKTAAVGDERQRDAGHRHNAHIHAHIDQHMAQQHCSDPHRDQAPKRVTRNDRR